MMILQDSTQSIFKNTKKYRSTSCSPENISSKLINAIQHLEDTKEKITLAQSSIDSFSFLSSKVELLSSNLAVMNASQSSHMNTLQGLQSPISVKALSSTKHQLQSSQEKISEIIQTIRSAEKSRSLHNISLEQHQRIERNIISSTEDIIRALQFEDIVHQITERAVLHISGIRLIVDKLSHLYSDELSSNFEGKLQSARKDIQTIREKIANESASTIAAQSNMNEGNIELF